MTSIDGFGSDQRNSKNSEPGKYMSVRSVLAPGSAVLKQPSVSAISPKNHPHVEY